jgi:hypothetical protein
MENQTYQRHQNFDEKKEKNRKGISAAFDVLMRDLLPACRNSSFKVSEVSCCATTITTTAPIPPQCPLYL